MQVIILAGIFAGIFTATEAAAVSAAYAILVEVLVLRSLTWRDVFNIAQESALSTSVIFILLAVGSLLAYFITLGNLQGTLTQLIQQWNVGWVGYLLAVNVLFLIAGMFIELFSVIEAGRSQSRAIFKSRLARRRHQGWRSRADEAQAASQARCAAGCRAGSGCAGPCRCCSARQAGDPGAGSGAGGLSEPAASAVDGR